VSQIEIELKKVLSRLDRMQRRRYVFKGEEIEVWKISPFWMAIERALEQIPPTPPRSTGSRPSVGWVPLEEE